MKTLSEALRADPFFRRMGNGIHLEGPYISPEEGFRGAHPREFIRRPRWEEAERFQEACNGETRCITLAPEMEGAIPFIERAVKNGIVIGLGHTNASEEVLEEAYRAGARLSCHLGNGAHALLAKKAIGHIYYTEVDYWHGIKPTFASYPWIRRKEFAGGAMITGGCHAADIARYLKGEVTEVFAYRCKNRDDFDYPTTLVAAVKFQDGSVGKLSASLDGLCFPYQLNVDLLGTEGAIRDNRVYSKTLFPAQTDFVTVTSPTPNSGAVAHHPFQEEIDNLADNILNDTPILSDVLDACNSMEVVIAVEESAATGKPVGITGK